MARALQYKAYDGRPLNGRSFYRLKQTDFDGRFDYSPVVAVENTPEFQSMKLFPNPSSGNRLYVQLEGFQDEQLQLSLFNAVGNVYYHRREKIEASSFLLDIKPRQPLNPGIYYLKLISLKGEKIHKILIR